MEFAQRVHDLARRSKLATVHASTEEATKTAVILPLIQTLGFDVFNPEEVVPEFVADVGIKKGEKIDYAIKIDGQIAILIEAKPISMALGNTQYSQLYRYFGVSSARLAILTNGREVWFFSDIEEKNKMDKQPFFRFDLQSYDDMQVTELARFQKGIFAIDAILEAASNLGRVKAAAAYLKKQLATPDDDFVRLVGRQFHDGTFTKAAIDQLRPVVQSALDEVVRSRIQDKLNVTFGGEPAPANGEPVEKASGTVEEPDVITTNDEQMAFMIVRAIGSKVAPVERITIRDSKSYCAVFMDDNNRKPVCRFYFNAKSVKTIGLFDASKAEVRHQIASPVELYKFAPQIEEAVSAYL